MAGQGFDPNFTFSWPTARIGVMEGDSAVVALYSAELETLVANEVSALEHAYNDNEVRIRGLLQDLGSQRETLVGLKLNKIGRTSSLPDTPATRGMINKVKHLVRVVDGK